MKLFTEITKQSPNGVFISIFLGMIAGGCYAFMIPLILESLTQPDALFSQFESSLDVTFLGIEIANVKFAALFGLICFLILFFSSVSQVMLTRISINMTTDLRLRICEAISRCSLVDLEKLGSTKLVNTIINDVNNIVDGARTIPDLLVSTVTIMGMLSFLLVLNSDIFWLVIMAIIFGIFTYQIPMHFANKYFYHSRDKFDDLQESIQGLIFGFKELKLSKEKNDYYSHNKLVSNEQEVLQANKTGYTIALIAANYGDLISFIVIGITTFIFVNYYAISNSELIGVVMSLLYITGPASIIIHSIPGIAIAQVSLNKLENIFAQIPDEDINSDINPLPPWDSINFRDVCFQYPGQDNEAGFKVGPINLELKKGEVTFLIGGNGSGKSTLSKLMTLHYLPSEGTVSFGQTRVDRDSVNSCRQTISSIYTDYYLFDRILGNMDGELADRINTYVKELALDKKVKVKNGQFSTTELSDGQKKRLAMIVSLIDNKEFYLFDEWAADQDPDFKKIFYHEIIHDLKNRGKTVVVISHDDHYFDVADRIIVMQNGNLESEVKVDHVES